MTNITFTKQLLFYINHLIDFQLLENNKTIYQYYFFSKNERDLFDIVNFKDEINYTVKPEISVLIDIYNQCENNLKLFKQLNETKNEDAIKKTVYLTFHNNNFYVHHGDLPAEHYRKEFDNGFFWDYCYNIAMIIEPIIESKKDKFTLKSICNEAELKDIRKTLIDEKIISKINEADFLHHFTGQQMNESIKKIVFLCIGKQGKPNKDRLFTLISSLINETSLKKYYDKIDYSIRDNNNEMIKLTKDNKRITKISFNFKNICHQAKSRLNS